MLPDFNDQSVQMYLITAIWPQVAPFAYLQYLAKGRGAIAIDLREMEMTVVSPNEVVCKGDAYYKTAEELSASHPGVGVTFDRCRPQTDVMFLFQHRPHMGEPQYLYLNFALTSARDLPTPKNLLEAKAALVPRQPPVHFKTPVLFDPPGVDIRSTQFLSSFVRQGWSQFAFVAYNNYRNAGRGALIVDFGRANSSRQFATTNLQLAVCFVGVNEEAMGFCEQVDQVRSVLQSYNPDEQAIFLFSQGNIDQRGFMDVTVFIGPIGGDPSPRKVFEAQAKLQ